MTRTCVSCLAGACTGRHRHAPRTARRPLFEAAGECVFLALAIYVTAHAASTLWGREALDESLVGIALAVASLVIMPIVS